MSAGLEHRASGGEVMLDCGPLDERLEGPRYVLPENAPYEVWANDLRQLVERQRRTPWQIGFAVIAGEERFGDRVYQTFDDLGLKRKTVRQYAWVTRQCASMQIDVENLTFSHYMAVASLDLPEREDWLDRAREQDWDHKRLGMEVARAKRLAQPLPAPAQDERYRLIHADIAVVASNPFPYGIEAESVDLIVTDPPYDADSVPLYTDLWRLALRVLKPGGSAFVMTGGTYLHDYLNALDVLPLVYYWMIAYLTPGATPSLPHRDVGSGWKPILWFVNGAARDYRGPFVPIDVVQSDAAEKDAHEWQQSVSGMSSLMPKIARPDELVLDPFAGTGTTGIAALHHGCRFVGIEADDRRALPQARARLAAALGEAA